LYGNWLILLIHLLNYVLIVLKCALKIFNHFLLVRNSFKNFRLLRILRNWNLSREVLNNRRLSNFILNLVLLGLN